MTLKKWRRRLGITLLVGIFLSIVLYLGLELITRDTLLSIAQTRTEALGIRLMNEAVTEVISQNTHYQDLITLSYDKDGEVTIVQADTMRINLLSAEVALLVHDKFILEANDEMEIPLSSLLGLNLINAKWPAFKVELIQDSSLSSNYVSRYESVGINQSLYSIYLRLEMSINLIAPVNMKNIIVKTEMLICETLVVGDVPNIYWGSQMEGQLDFIP